MTYWKYIRLAGMLLALLGMLASRTAAATPPPQSLRSSGWNGVYSPNPGSQNVLNGVAAASKNDVWAVGYFQKGTHKKTLTEHWDGKTWKVVSSPNLSGDNVLHAVTAVPGTNHFWAVGDIFTTGQTLIEYWNGTAWSIVQSPKLGNILQGVAAESPNDVWAVGYYISNGKYHNLIEHWNGTSWSIVPSPGGGYFTAVSAISANDAWAVGENGHAQTLTERWNGAKWSLVPSPNPRNYQHELTSVTQVAGTNQAWAVGRREPYYVFGPFLAEHWNGTKWSLIPMSPAFSGFNILNGVASAGGPNNVVAVGWGTPDDGGGVPLAIIEQWDGSHWNLAWSGASFTVLNAAAWVPGSNNLWAVGYSGDGSHHLPYRTLIIHYY